MQGKTVPAFVAAGALAAAANGLAVGDRAGVVTITDRGVRPTTLTVPAGTAVTWMNHGKRAHRIRSTIGAWAPFMVAANRSRSVRIGLPGRYPYRVDGRRGGVVIAVPSRASSPPYARSAWTGRMSSFGTLTVPGNECHERFTTTFALKIGDTGKVSGRGDATADMPATCTIQPEQPPVTAVTIRVEGVVTSTAFHLRLFPIAATGQLEAGFFANWLSAGGYDPPVQVVPFRSARTAAVQLTLTDTGPYKAGTVENSIALTCTNCASG